MICQLKYMLNFNFYFINRLGFTSYMTIPELVDIFPELDFVDHNKRKELLVSSKGNFLIRTKTVSGQWTNDSSRHSPCPN